MSTYSIEWNLCLLNVKLSEFTTTSSQRILLKILFQELASNLGIDRLHQKILAKYVIPGIKSKHYSGMSIEKQEEQSDGSESLSFCL